jgi:hypothetical protein
MSEARARKINQGEIWIDQMDTTQVIVVRAGDKYVEFMRYRTTEIYWIRHFLERFAPYYHRKQIRDQFQQALVNLDAFHAFWCPERHRLFARTAKGDPNEAYKPTRGRGGAVPASAHYIGTYTYPFNADEFLGDLDALITRLNAQQRTPQPHGTGTGRGTPFVLA